MESEVYEDDSNAIKIIKIESDSGGSVCFLCLQPISSFSGSHCSYEDNSKNKSYHFLRNMFRLLGLEDEQHRFAQEPFQVCRRCSNVSDQFTELYRILEETRLHLDGCLHRISEIMKGAVVRDDPFQLQPKVGKEKGGLLELMRERTLDKCRKRLKSAAPKVLLSRCRPKAQEPRSEATPFKLVDPLMLHPSEMSDEIHSVPLPLLVVVRRSHPELDTTPLPLPATNDSGPPPKKNPAYGSRCRYCDTIVPPGKMNPHFLRFHCEHFFPLWKDVFSPSQFKEIAKSHLFGDFLTGDDRSLCKLCNYTNNCTRSFNRIFYAKLHLLRDHADVLGQKLEHLHKYGFPTPEVVQINFRAPAPPARDKDKLDSVKTTKIMPSVPCPYCETLIKKDKLNRHYLAVHPEHFFQNLNLSFASIPAEFKRILQSYVFSDCVNDDGACTMCDWKSQITSKHLRRTYLKMHLVKHHNEELARRLRFCESEIFAGRIVLGQSEGLDPIFMPGTSSESHEVDMEVQDKLKLEWTYDDDEEKEDEDMLLGKDPLAD